MPCITEPFLQRHIVIFPEVFNVEDGEILHVS